MPGDSNILLRIDSATKAAWQERARAEGQTLTGLIIGAVEGRSSSVGVRVTASCPERLGVAEAGAHVPVPAVPTPLPVPEPKDEPAPSAPQRAAGRGHSAMCTCLMCKG